MSAIISATLTTPLPYKPQLKIKWAFPFFLSALFLCHESFAITVIFLPSIDSCLLLKGDISLSHTYHVSVVDTVQTLIKTSKRFFWRGFMIHPSCFPMPDPFYHHESVFIFHVIFSYAFRSVYLNQSVLDYYYKDTHFFSFI